MAQDSRGVVSHMLKFEIFVLANLCENNSTCVGPDWDTKCKSLKRVHGKCANWVLSVS